MKIKLSANSWHAWLAQFLWGKRLANDICSYTWQVLWGLVRLIMVLGVATFVLYCFGNTFGWLLAGLLYSFVEPPHTAGIAIGLTIIFLFLCIFSLFEVLFKKVNADLSPPDFLSEAYKNFRDKTCKYIDWRYK